MNFRELGLEVMYQRDRDGVRGITREWSRWKCHIEDAPFVSKDVAAITTADIREWLRAMAQKKVDKTGAPLTTNTINRCQSLVSAVFAEAFERDIIQQNPCRGLKAKKSATEADTKEKWTFLTADEQTAIASCDAIPIADRLMIRFAVATGLRQGEIFCLHLADVHLDGADPHIVVRYGSRNRAGKLLPPKSGKKRIVSLIPESMSALTEWLALLPTFAPSSPHGIVWPQASGEFRQQGKPFGKHDVFKKHLALVGITRRVRFHDLRHTCATNLITGVYRRFYTIREVQDVMGHSSITMTERYAHLGDDARKRAAAETRRIAETPTAPEVPLQPNARTLLKQAVRQCVWTVRDALRGAKKYVA